MLSFLLWNIGSRPNRNDLKWCYFSDSYQRWIFYPREGKNGAIKDQNADSALAQVTTQDTGVYFDPKSLLTFGNMRS